MPVRSDEILHYRHAVPPQRATTWDHSAWTRGEDSTAELPNVVRGRRSPRPQEQAARAGPNVQHQERCNQLFERPRRIIDPVWEIVPASCASRPKEKPTVVIPYQPDQVNTSRRRPSDRPSTSSTTFAALNSQPLQKSLVEIPGTMSSQIRRRTSQDEDYIRRGDSLKQVSGNELRRKSSLVSRCKTAVKHVLCGSSPDESEIVYIKECHWTDGS